MRTISGIEQILSCFQMTRAIKIPAIYDKYAFAAFIHHLFIFDSSLPGATLRQRHLYISNAVGSRVEAVPQYSSQLSVVGVVWGRTSVFDRAFGVHVRSRHL